MHAPRAPCLLSAQRRVQMVMRFNDHPFGGNWSEIVGSKVCLLTGLRSAVHFAWSPPQVDIRMIGIQPSTDAPLSREYLCDSINSQSDRCVECYVPVGRLGLGRPVLRGCG
jgi:hypothetical protein